MSLSTPTKTTILNTANALALANSNLTSVRPGGRLNAINGATAALLKDIYRDLQVGLYQEVISGLFDLFSFSALPGSGASTTLTVTVSGATTIPIGYTGSTVGTASSPAIQFQSTQTVAATGAGTVSVPITSTNVGSNTNVAAGTITNIITSVPNVLSITNATAATGGTDPETQTAQLARFKKYLASLDGATVTALAYLASQTQGVVLAAAVAPEYLQFWQLNGTNYTDFSQSLNSPKGSPVAPFVSAPDVGDGLYIGSAGAFNAFYIDVSTTGSGLNATWQYYNGTAWATLTTTLDQTSNGQTSGLVTFAVPTDWAAVSVNGVTAFYVQLHLNSTTFTTMPQWYQVFDSAPPPGFVYVYITINPAVSNVTQGVQTALDATRAAGDTVIIYTATSVAQNITATIIPTQAGAVQDLSSLATTAIQSLFASLQIGQSLSISQITFAITSLGNGAYVSQVDVTTPATNIVVASSDILTLGTVTLTIGGAT